MPNEILKEKELIPLRRAVKYINIPETDEEIQKTIKRIKYEELFLYQLKIKYMLYMRKNFPQGVQNTL